MSTTPSIPGVDRDALADAVLRDAWIGVWSANRAADAALAYIAAHHECACDRDHADDWVEVPITVLDSLPEGAPVRTEWVRGGNGKAGRRQFVHRNDLPEDPDAEKIERMAQALFACAVPNGRWQNWDKDIQELYRKAARAALDTYRKEKER